MEQDTLDAHLSDLMDALITMATRTGLIREGVVMTVGPMPYRRLDCDGRALAYVRKRPKKRAVRIDVPGLWAAPTGSHLAIAASAGRALLLRSQEDVMHAVAFLLEAIEWTRRPHRRHVVEDSA